MVDGVNGNNFIYQIKRGDNLTKIAKANETTIDATLKLNSSIKDPNKIYAGHKLIITDNKPFVQKEDYSPDNMNIGSVSLGGQEIEQINGKPLKSNFFANDLGKLADTTVADGNSATKVVVDIQPGKAMTRKDNDTPYSILNKVLGDHLDNNSEIQQGEDGSKKIVNQKRLEDTDLYKAFISEDANGDNFTGENNKLLARGESGNRVQLPAVEIDSNGTKYFTLHGSKEVLYFDDKGTQVTFENGVIKSNHSSADASKKPEIPSGIPQKAPENPENLARNGNKDKALNVGNYYINGQVVSDESVKPNFYQNNVNIFMQQTLNDKSYSSRLDIQLNMGANISARDTAATDILKKMLGNNFDKASKPSQADGKYGLAMTALQNTDLYKAFVSENVNGNNFASGKLQRAESGFNTVQFPALEADANGYKYYVLHTSDNTVLYFDDKGAQVQPTN